MVLYNTLSHKKEEFVPVEAGKVKRTEDKRKAYFSLV